MTTIFIQSGLLDNSRPTYYFFFLVTNNYNSTYTATSY